MAQEPRLKAFEQALKDEGIAGTQLEPLARSIFQQESGSGKNVKTSNAGARGPMQVLPTTFKAYNPQGNIDDPYDNSVGGLRYIKDLFSKTNDPGLTAVGYYGGPKAIEKAKAGVAVSDPRNPKAPTTLQYMEQVMGRTGQASPAGKAPAGQVAPKGGKSPVNNLIRQRVTDLGPNYQAALALMARADDLDKAREKIAEEEDFNTPADFSQARQMLTSLQPIKAFAEGGEAKKESPSMGEKVKSTAKEILRSTQYAPYDLLGAPADIGNLALKGVDYVTGSKLATDKPVGGSEWLIQKARGLGIADEPTGSTTETLTRLGTGILSPTAGPRAVAAAGQAVKGTAKAALEDLAMAGTGQGGSKIAQNVAKATGLEPSFAVPKNAKSLLQQLDTSLITPTEASPFVGRLEQTLFDSPQDIFTPQQLTSWAKKNLPGQDADRLTQAISPLMNQKRLTKQEILTAVNNKYSPKQFTLEITKPNEPIRNNPYLESYPKEDMPYIGADKLKSTGVIVAKKPAQDVGQLRLEGTLDSIASHPKALDNYLSGVDPKTAPGNLANIQNYLESLPLIPIQKAQSAGLFERFASTNQKLANAKQSEKLFSQYQAQKFDLDPQEQINLLDKIADNLGVETTLLRPEQVERQVHAALYEATEYGAREAAEARNALKQFVLEVAPQEQRFFPGRPLHEFQGANAIGFSRYVDLNVDGKNLMGISEFQSDLRRSLKESRSSATGKASREAEAIEMFPNMEKRPEVITQNLIKNAVYAAAKLDKDGLILPGMMSKKPELYTSVNKHAKAALKDMGLDTAYLKKADPTKVYDKDLLEEKIVNYYNNNLVNTGEEVSSFDKLPYEEQQYLLDYFAPYAIYLPKKERKSILQYGIPYAKGGMVDKNDPDNQKYI